MNGFKKFVEQHEDEFWALLALTLKDVADGKRNRLYPAKWVVTLMVLQALGRNMSCQNIVTKNQAMHPEAGMSGSSAAFCRARGRLGEETAEGLFGNVDEHARGLLKCGGISLGGRAVKAVDGTSFRAEDTAANRAEWDYPSGQKEGCGFPVLGALGSFSLDTGTFSSVSFANHTAHDIRLALGALRDGAFAKGDIIVGDRAFCAYSFFSLLLSKGVDVIARVHGTRKLHEENGLKLGPDEWIESWRKPQNHPMRTLTDEERAAVPKEISVRIIHAQFAKKGFRTKEVWLSTTLLDHEKYPAKEIIKAYRKRWEIEGAFRDIKTVMCYEMVRGRTPESVRKQLYIAFLTYNLCQALMLAAAGGHRKRQAKLSPSRIEALVFLVLTCAAFGVKIPIANIVAIAKSTSTKKRKRRGNVRAKKWRGTTHPNMTKPRDQYIEPIHRGRRTKGRAETSVPA